MRQYHNSSLSFIDLLLNAVAVFAILLVLTLMIINDPAHPQTKVVDEKAKVMIVMTWADDSSDDMDLWLCTPEADKNKVGYNQPNGNIANLARDDLGKENDMFLGADGQIHYIHLNREVITVREKLPGHYIVDTMFYHRAPDPENNDKLSVGPQEVTVQVIQIDPVYKEVVTKSVMLDEEKDVKTAVSFDIDDHGEILNVDTTTQVNFVTGAP